MKSIRCIAQLLILASAIASCRSGHGVWHDNISVTEYFRMHDEENRPRGPFSDRDPWGSFNSFND